MSFPVLKKIGRNALVQTAVGRGIAAYLRLVQKTSSVTLAPSDFYERASRMAPFIGAMWHGQHFMVPYLKRPQDAAASMVSRSRDGEFNAQAIRALGIRPIRGSGARGRDLRQKGGAGALRGMMRALEGGENAFMTADVPKISRRCGDGIITLASLSERPILAVAVASGRSVTVPSWDKSTVGLPFGRIAIVVGEPIWVARRADAGAREAARIELERELDRVHRDAFAAVGRADPGARAGRPSA